MYTKILKIITCFIFGISLVKCNTVLQNPPGSTFQEDFDAFVEVNLTDGINQSEAYTIAKAYFWSNISRCGFPDTPVINHHFWVSQTRIGYASTPGAPITINRDTGDVTWDNKTITFDKLKQTLESTSQ